MKWNWGVSNQGWQLEPEANKDPLIRLGARNGGGHWLCHDSVWVDKKSKQPVSLPRHIQWGKDLFEPLLIL